MFKFIYSCRLAEMGFATQAFHYCEVIARSILLQPHAHSPVLLRQLVQVLSSCVSVPGMWLPGSAWHVRSPGRRAEGSCGQQDGLVKARRS